MEQAWSCLRVVCNESRLVSLPTVYRRNHVERVRPKAPSSHFIANLIVTPVLWVKLGEANKEMGAAEKPS